MPDLQPQPRGTDARVWSWVAGQLGAGPVALGALVAASGSSPGRIGSVLAASRAGTVGTVGGGPAESTVLARARELLVHPGNPEVIDLAHRPGAANASGLGCGGSASYVIWRLDAGQREQVAHLAAEVDSGQRRGWLLDRAGWRTGAPPRVPGVHRTGDGWRVEAACGPRGRVLIAGGGHVGAALSGLLVECDFAVAVAESRTGVATFTANSHAHHLVTCQWSKLPFVVVDWAATMVVVATHDPQADAAAMAALLPLDLDYLGLLGSRAKVARILGTAHPRHVHAPAGMAIGSQTPTEIAVSITAELLAQRAASTAGPVS